MALIGKTKLQRDVGQRNVVPAQQSASLLDAQASQVRRDALAMHAPERARELSGRTPPSRWNAAWWEMRENVQGIRPPIARSEDDFDPGAKFHVPANVPCTRYFLSSILRFQFHRALCDAAGYERPLHQCSIYGSDADGRRLKAMLEMGRSRPWQDAMQVIAGTDRMDAGAVIDYYAPLKRWLDKQNEGRRCGW